MALQALMETWEVGPVNTDKCLDCDVSMDLVGEQQVCPKCGAVERYHDNSETKLSNTRLVIRTGHRTSTYNHTHDYAATRLGELNKVFAEYARRYTGPAIPPNVLHRVAECYIDLDNKAHTCKDLRVRYRGGNKHQILARMIFYACIGAGVHRTAAEIGQFMQMAQNTRFATGENILRKLQAHKLVDIVIDETPEIIAARYIELFALPPGQAGFIGETIAIAARCNIMMQARMVSKTIGMVWMLCCRNGAKVTLRDFETITGVRAPTFTAFITAVTSPRNFYAFYALYRKYGVALL